MKRKSFILALIAIISAVSCQEPEPENPGTTANKPQLVSSTPEDGATGIIGSSLDLVLTFDMNVMCPTAQQSRITVSGGATIDRVNAYMKDVTLSISGLLRGQTYTVTFPEGTVSGYSNNPAEEFTVTFSTQALAEQEIAASLVTENPSPAASKLYDYLKSIYGTKTLSGAIADVAWNTDEADWVAQHTGKYPAVAHFDYIHLASSPANWINYGDITVVKNWWQSKGLVGACWHWNVPTSESAQSDPNSYTCTTSMTTFRPTAALTEGTWENEFLTASLEKIAGYLKLLQNEGIPVIWRPLHEAAGNTYTQYQSGAWFWWGADGPEKYKELWIYVFNYFKDAGLNNLIWVWTTQTSSSADSDYAFYPGDEYVDIVGRDIYNTSSASEIALQYENLMMYYPNKMLALSELGNVADMASEWNAGAKWLFFMPWYDHNNDGTRNYAHDHATISWWESSYASDAVVTRDELPSELFE